MVFLNRADRLVSHNGFGGAFQLAADQNDFIAAGCQPLCMGNCVGHENGGGCSDKIDHMRCRRSRIEKDEIIRFNQGCRILCNFPLGVAVQLIFLCNGVLMRRHFLTGLHGTAEYLFQLALLIERRDIAAYRRFRSVEKIPDFRHGNASLFF